MRTQASQPVLQAQFARLIQGITLRRFALGVVLTMSLRAFTFFPGVRPLEELWFGVCLIGFVILYPLLKIQSDWTFTPWELYLCFVIPILVILPAVTAHNEFGQPLSYGLLARRSVALDTTWLVFMGAWRRRWITSKDVEVVLLSLAWASFFIYSFMSLFLNPASFASAPPGFILGSGTADAAFAVPGCFMVFGVLYYALKGLRLEKSRYYLFALILFVTSIGKSGRFLTVALFATVGYFLFRWRPLGQVISTLFKFAAVAVLMFGLAFSVSPDLVRDRVVRFGEAFQVVSGGQGQDASANARIIETAIALPYIKEHPLVGVGVLSNQWIGAADAIATYFFTDDIGFVGIIFNYGALGLGLLLLQYIFAISAGLRIPVTDSDHLKDSAKAFVLYTVIYSGTTGLFVFSFEQSSFFITLLILLSQQHPAMLTDRDSHALLSPTARPERSNYSVQ